jgi:hypothetical protein
MARQYRKLLPTQAALKNGLDAISPQKAPEQNDRPNSIASKQIKPNDMNKRTLSIYKIKIMSIMSFSTSHS